MTLILLYPQLLNLLETGRKQRREMGRKFKHKLNSADRILGLVETDTPRPTEWIHGMPFILYILAVAP